MKEPNTVALFGDYKDVLFYLFIIGFALFLWALHQYFEEKQRRKENSKLFYTPEERERMMKSMTEHCNADKN